MFLCGFTRGVFVITYFSLKIWGLIKSSVLHFVDYCSLHTFLPEKRTVSAVLCIVSQSLLTDVSGSVRLTIAESCGITNDIRLIKGKYMVVRDHIC